jgi:hypothetical protein
LTSSNTTGRPAGTWIRVGANAERSITTWTVVGPDATVYATTASSPSSATPAAASERPTVTR